MKALLNISAELHRAENTSPRIKDESARAGYPAAGRRCEPAWFAAVICALGLFTPMARGAIIVHDFYLPMPEAQIKQTFDALETGVGTTLDSTFAVEITGDGTVIYYDQWEDGYEIDLAHPAQASTQIWGDGNNLNGIPPGFVTDPVGGLPAGTALTLRNLVPLPRNPSNLLFDGRDRVAATKALVISRMAWPTSPGSVLADAVQVPATIDYGTNYVSPVGQDLTNALFRYVALFVMAGEDGTSVTIDTDGIGPTAPFAVALNRGESYLVNGGIKKGASATANRPFQAYLVVGKIAARYASDWFTLSPVSEWGSSYVTPVPTPASGNGTFVYLYNPNTNAVTINFITRLGSGSFPVAANGGVSQYLMPKGSGARFTSAGGERFFALSTVAANPGNEAAYDWGLTLLATDNLTTVAVVGLGFGSADGTQNGSPVWVTPLASTRVYADYNGDRAGALTDPNGGKYDAHFDLVALQSQKIYDPDKNQTGMRVYTLDGTLISTAWGEDPDVAAAGNPYIDAGTTVFPFPTPVLTKTSAIVNDTNAPGLSIGDTLEYTIQLDNRGLLPLGNTLVIDTLPTNISYVADSTSLDSNPIADNGSGTIFPLDAPGYTIPVILRGGTSSFKFRVTVVAAGVISNSVNAVGYNLAAQNVIAPGSTNSTQCALDFTDAGGTPVTAYVAGGSVYAKVTDADGNTSSNTVQSVSVVVSNLTRGDFELVTLTETGINTGSFRNVGGLPTSVSSGLAQLDGTLNAAPGDVLTVRYTDATFADFCTASASVQAPAQTKILYLSDPSQSLDRVDPVATGDGTTAQSVELGGGASATIGVDGTNSVAGTNVSSLSFSYTTGTGANRLMLVSVGTDETTPVSSVTYNGVALTSVTAVADAGSTKPRIEIFSLTNPAAGVHTLAVTLNAAANAFVGVNTFTNVDQITPLGGPNTNMNATSVTVSSAANELVYGTVCGAQTETDAVGQTRLWSRNQGTIFGAGSTKPGATSVTMTWTPGGGSSKIAMAAVPVKPTTSGGVNTTSFTQTPVFCQNFSLPAGGAVNVTNYVAVTSGSMPANPNITGTLRYGSTSLLTLSNPAYNGGAGTLVWSGTISSNVTVPVGQALSLDISNAQSGVAYRIEHDSTTRPSKVTLPTTTVIDVTSVGVYDAPYPGGSLVTTPLVGATLYVRVGVSDPFGSYDISSLGLSLDGPGVSGDINTTLINSSVVVSNSCSKTYEYVWNSSVDGTFNINATANEGTEGITDVGSASVTLIVLDTGTPSSAEFTSGNNGVAINAFPANGTVCVRISDSDKNTNSATAQTIGVVIISGSGDSETVTLTETSTNTGVFTACITASTNGGVGANNGTLNAPVSTVLTVTYTDPDDLSDQSSATATVIPPPGTPGVTMNKTLISPADGQAGVGESVLFNLQVVNSGSTTLTNVSVTDNFPSNKLSYVSASLAPNVIGAGVLTWTDVGPLAVGTTTNILVSFTAIGTTNSAVNAAVANAGGGTTNLSSAGVQITHAALTITKSLLNPTNGPVYIGSNVTFRIEVQNTGDTAIPTLPLEDTFSSSCFSFVSATVTPDGTGAGSLLWTNVASGSPLATNATITIDVTMVVTGGCDPADNTAHADYAVDSNGDPVPPATSTAGITTGAARIIGNVYDDADQSGTLTIGDSGLSGVTIELYTDPNADGDPSDGVLTRLVNTDPTGAYELLNLSTGAYVVVETDLAGYASVAPLNNRLSVVVTGLTTNANNNFFDYLIPPINYATISGTVWGDTNANGIVDGGDYGLGNVTVELIQDVNTNGFADLGETVTASTTTATNGTYSFANVIPGNYVVRETDLYGWISTADSFPPNDSQIAILVGSGAVTNANDFLDFFTGNNPGNDAPVANNDVYGTSEDTTLTISASGILGNDTDVDGDTLTALLVSTTTNGTLTLSTNGGFIYTPNSNYFGSDAFTYRANDGTTNSGIATVNITISAVNDVPVANNDAYTTAEDTTLTIPVAGILTNDTDVEGSALTALLVNTTTNGVLSLNPDGSFTYTPNTNFNGSDSFTYRASDGSATSAVATVTITITPANDTPVANDDAYTTTEDIALTIPVAGILTNDTDMDGDTLTALLVSTTTNGTLSLSTNGGFLYTPNFNYFGGDSFTYRATDGGATSAVATVTITITAQDDLPEANPDTYTVNEDGGLNGNVTTNDVPSGDGGNAWTVVTNVAHGVLSLSTNGTFTYTPTANYNGPDSFTYQVCDADNDCSTATVTITVASVNDLPVASPDSYGVNEDGVLNGDVSTNDVPSADGGNVWSILTNAANGVVTMNTNGTFIYTPTANYNGPDSFTYQICDAQNDCASATVTITVSSVNDLPTANPDAYTVNEDAVLNGNVSTNDVSSGDGGNVWSLLTNAANGVVTMNTNGTFTYTPAANYNGPDSFTYQLCDANSDCSIATVTLTVSSVNDVPVANLDNYFVIEDGVLNGNVSTNDVPSGDGGNVWTVLTNVAHGVLSLSTNGTFTYTPATNYNGPDSFTYQVCDVNNDCSSATVTISVSSVDNLPVANPDTYTVNEDGALNGNVTTNDVPSGDGGNVWSVLTNVTHGVLSLSTNGTFTYTPAANYNGPDSFTYQLCDVDGDCVTATVAITVNSVDDAPIANPDSYAVNEDGALNGNVTTNDLPSGDGGNVWTVLTNVTHGVLNLSTNGTFTYTPTNNYNGPESFTYQLCDADGDCVTATVSITVNSVDDAPIANPDSYTVNEDGVLNGNVTTNDVPSGDGGNVWSVLTNVTHGVLSLSTNGTFTYTPAANYNGPDSFTYQVCDTDGDCSSATVTITVSSVDDFPAAGPDAYTVNEDGALNGNVTTNDVPSGDGGNAWTVLTNVTHGVLSLSTNGTFTYTPTANYNGPDSFTYQVCDADGDCATATVTITVQSVDDAPVANPDTYTVSEDGVLNGNVTTNDVPSGDGGNVWSVLTNATHGVVTMNTNGTFTYTPTANYNGPDSFTYQLCDTDNDCSSATVTLTVSSVNDTPVANPDSYNVAEDGTLNGNVTTNDVPSGDGGNVWTVLTNVAHGVLSLSTNGTFTYTPATNYNGPDSFTYQVCDVNNDCSTATVTISVSSVDNLPVANPDTYTVNEDGALNGNVTTNDVPSGDGGNVWTVLTNVTHGGLSLSTNGTFTYTPTANYNGPESFTYQVCDTDGDCSAATVTINVTSVDDAPTANPDSYSVNEDGVLNGNVTTNDVPSGDGGNVWNVVTNVVHGVLSLSTNGTFTYTPTGNYNGPDSFTYQVCDADGDCSSATVTVTVASVNDAPVANPDSYTTLKNIPLVIPAAGILTNDTDLEGNTLTVIPVTGTANGSLILNANGGFTYTPLSNYVGLDTFTYRATDGSATSGVATVTINILPTNTAPTAVNNTYTTSEDTALTIPAAGILTNDIDPDGDTLSALLGTNVIHGTLSLNPNGSFTYTPFTNYNGSDSFTYRAYDGVATSGVATVTINITPVNDPPVAINDTTNTFENVSVTINVLVNDGDPEGTPLTITGFSTTNGVIANNGTNLVFTPTTNFNGTAVFSYTITDGTNTANASVTTTVTSLADVRLSKSASASVNAGANLNYTLIVSNAGPGTASSLSVTDSLPAGVTFVSATGGGALNGNQVIWANLGSLLVGASTNLTLTVTAPATGTLSNTAVVFTPTSDPNPTNNTAGPVITTVTPLADVSLSKSAQGSVNAGANFTYTLVASNAGPSTASSLSVTDSLPAGVTFVSATGGGALNGNQVIWANLGSLLVGASTNLTLTVTAPASGTLSNTAVVVTPTGDPNPTNNTAGPVLTSVQSLSDVAVFKTGPTNIVAGGPITYTVTVTNLGPSTATNTIVTDTLPVGATFQNASGSYTFSNGVVTWAAVTLANGGSASYTITLTAPLSGNITNRVSATSSTPDPVPSNNDGSSPNSQVGTTVTPIADVVVGKTGPSSVTTGVNFDYTISVTNLGPLSATNVVVTDLLPTNLVFVSASGGGVLASNVVTWPTIAALANGATTNFIITVRSPVAGNFTNIAVAVSVTPDPNSTNNSSGNPGAQVPTAAVPPQFGFYQAPNVFNPQTGLFEQRVTVTNTGVAPVAAFRLLVGNINGTNGVPRTNVFLYNATGTNVDLRPYIQYNSTLNPGSNVTLILEFYVPDRKPFTNSIEVVSVSTNATGTNAGAGVVIDRAFVDARFSPVRFVIEWTSAPGTNYTVIYSDASASGPWTAAIPSITANANRVQWYDDGPPKTISVPLSVTNRFYRVISNP